MPFFDLPPAEIGYLKCDEIIMTATVSREGELEGFNQYAINGQEGGRC